MKKFLKKYGYILLVVVIAAGCYTGFRAFRYYYHDTDDYCLRTYGTMARVEESVGKQGCCIWKMPGTGAAMTIG